MARKVSRSRRAPARRKAAPARRRAAAPRTTRRRAYPARRATSRRGGNSGVLKIVIEQRQSEPINPEAKVVEARKARF